MTRSTQVPDVDPIITPAERWERGIAHDARSAAIYEFISRYDLEHNDDSLSLRSGGDGDNGEALMYLLDEFFAASDQAAAPEPAEDGIADGIRAVGRERLKSVAERLSRNAIGESIAEFKEVTGSDEEPTDRDLEFWHAGYKKGALGIIDHELDRAKHPVDDTVGLTAWLGWPGISQVEVERVQEAMRHAVTLDRIHYPFRENATVSSLVTDPAVRVGGVLTLSAVVVLDHHDPRTEFNSGYDCEPPYDYPAVRDVTVQHVQWLEHGDAVRELSTYTIDDIDPDALLTDAVIAALKPKEVTL